MSKLFLEEKHIVEYIKDTLSDSKLKRVAVENAKYHHNISYYDAATAIKYGILSLTRLNELGIKKYSPKQLELMNDLDSHINGSDGVSLSIVGLTDLSAKEEEYNPYDKRLVDFLITSDIQTKRMTHHYGNEFIFNGDLLKDKFKSVDVRLLQSIESNSSYPKENTAELIKKYNCLKDIALSLKQENLDIPFREMSFDEGSSLDMCKLLKAPTLVLK